MTWTDNPNFQVTILKTAKDCIKKKQNLLQCKRICYDAFSAYLKLGLRIKSYISLLLRICILNYLEKKIDINKNESAEILDLLFHS